MSPEEKIKVSVCVVTYNREEETVECLNSIYTSKLSNFEVVLFDNHSEHKLDSKVLANYPHLRYIYHERNIGNAGGRNFCEKIAGGEYIMFLDSDVIIDQDTLGELANALDNNPMAGIVAAKMFFYDGGKTNVFIAGLGRFSKINTLCTDVTTYKEDVGQFDSQVDIDYAQNGYMVRKSVSQKIGGHNPAIFMTYLEVDYFLRVQKLGYKTMYIPRAKLWHKTRIKPEQNNLRDLLGLTRPLRIYYNMRNRSFIVKAHYSWYAKIVYLLFWVHLFLLYYFLKFVLYKAPKDYYNYLWRGYIHGILIFLGIRRLEQ